MTLTEELITQAQNFDKGSALRALLERAAHYITELEQQRPQSEPLTQQQITSIEAARSKPTPLPPLHPFQDDLPSIGDRRNKPRKDV